jgi:gamma-glutamyl hercynylcysteine S-oxide synthase
MTEAVSGDTMVATQRKLANQQILIARLAEARNNTDELFRIVRTDALYDRPIPERHRIIFYLGHLEAFDWNLFRQGNSSLQSFSPEYDKLFAFGIDPVDGGLPADRVEDWPSLSNVEEYNKRLRQTIDDSVLSGRWTLSEPTVRPALDTLLHVAIEHRLMHAETLAYMFHRLPRERKNAQKQKSVAGRPVRHEMLRIPAGHTCLGLARSDASRFGWDNEYEGFDAHVPSFRIDKCMVTNEDFLNFLLDGGYDDHRLWAPQDWQWKESQGIHHPAFWQNVGGEWLYRGMFEDQPLPLGWPVYVSHAEARAYAKWTKKELPTEAQWQRAAYGVPNAPEREFPWGNIDAPSEQGNFDFARWDPVDVNAFPNNQSAFGVVGQLGNGWEWTSTAFASFEGFKPFSFYPGYSANFFDGKHFVLKGGSARTAACMLRPSFRNWFQPHYQYVYAGFRCISI